MRKTDGTTLTDVSETALLTLWSRGSEAARPNSIIDDPFAARLIEQIDYPYRKHFGPPTQAFAIRAATFDSAVREFLREHPGGTVVSLAEGLQTSYWRLGRPKSPWISVDLPPIMALRKELLPEEHHVVSAGLSALDPAWMDLVESGAPVLITAEGLLYYLDKSLALGLIRDCAQRFPGGRFVFDSIPRVATSWTKPLQGRAGALLLRLTKRNFLMPRMPFGLSARAIDKFPEQIPGVASARRVPVFPGRGLIGRAIKGYYEFPLIPNAFRGTITELRFSS